VKGLQKGTIFSIGISLDSKWISKQKSDNFIGLEFNRIASWNFKFG
jgi:hypothetical protein